MDDGRDDAATKVMLFEQWWVEGHPCPKCGDELTPTTLVTDKLPSKAPGGKLVFKMLVDRVRTTTMLWLCAFCSPPTCGWSIRTVVDALVARKRVFDTIEESP